NKVRISSLRAPSCNNSAKISAFSRDSSSQETIIREGYKLSYKAFDSRKNSGLNKMFFVLYFLRTDSVYPTGMVDLIIIVALGLAFNTNSITVSTAEVSKKFNLLS